MVTCNLCLESFFLNALFATIPLVNPTYFSVQWFKLHLILERISIFYQVFLKMSRLEKHNLLIFVTYMAVLFSQKPHDNYFSHAYLLDVYCD